MVPIRLDIFTAIIFLGAIQGLFLSVFFFLKRDTPNLSNTLLGGLVLTFAAFSFDIFLGYSGYMTQVLHLVDFTEPLNFVIGPLIFLYVITAINRQNKLKGSQYLHFLPAIIYLAYCFFFYLQTVDYKYNAYIDAYYPELPRRDAPALWDEDPFFLRKNLSLLQFLHTSVYLVYAAIVYGRWARTAALGKRRHEFAHWLRLMLVGIGVGMGVVFLVKLVLFERDLGEYLIASALMVMIYSFSFYVIVNSTFFKSNGSPPGEKYERSSFPKDRVYDALSNLKRLMETEKPFLSPDFSLPMLADKLGLTSHAVSQLLNAHVGLNFYEYTASYRVEEAKRLLANPESAHKSIEQIAEEVGYYSKSSFNTAFKKITEMTPSQYRKQAMANSE